MPGSSCKASEISRRTAFFGRPPRRQYRSILPYICNRAAQRANAYSLGRTAATCRSQALVAGPRLVYHCPVPIDTQTPRLTCDRHKTVADCTWQTRCQRLTAECSPPRPPTRADVINTGRLLTLAHRAPSLSPPLPKTFPVASGPPTSASAPFNHCFAQLSQSPPPIGSSEFSPQPGLAPGVYRKMYGELKTSVDEPPPIPIPPPDGPHLLPPTPPSREPLPLPLPDLTMPLSALQSPGLNFAPGFLTPHSFASMTPPGVHTPGAHE